MSSFPPNFPTQTQRHYLRYRRSSANAPWAIAGPFYGTRSSVAAVAAYAGGAVPGLTVDADERVVLPEGSDVKETDTLLCIETNRSSVVQTARDEPGFLEVYLKSQRLANPLPAPFSSPA